MKQVYKHRIEYNIINRIPMKLGTSPLHFDCIDGVMYLWCESDIDEDENEYRSFEVYGTGWDIPQNHIYCGTVIAGAFVWHIYECR